MQTVYFKEHEGGVVQNSIGALSISVPWWGSGMGSQSGAYGAEPYGQLKCSSMVDLLSVGDQLKGLEKEDAPKFTIFPGDCGSSTKGENLQLQMANSTQTAPPPEYNGRFELGFGQPLICAKYPYGDQYFGVLSTYGPQNTGRVMLPLNLTTDDAPIYVNAKQYHGIIRRRQCRAKAEMENRLLKGRKQPYMHLSRHLHAMRRPRGCGGRFLNTKKSNGGKFGADNKKKTGHEQLFHPAESQSSEVLQSDSGNLNSPKEANRGSGSGSGGGGSYLSGSEVTSMYSRGFEFNNHFSIGHLHPAVQFLPNGINTGHGIGVHGKWNAAAAAADSCCNLKV